MFKGSWFDYWNIKWDIESSLEDFDRFFRKSELRYFKQLSPVKNILELIEPYPFKAMGSITDELSTVEQFSIPTFYPENR